MDRTINVVGFGEMKVKPDIMQIRFSVNACDKKYDKALKTVDSKVVRLQTILMKAGIRKKNIITTNFSVSQKHQSIKDSENNYKQEFIGFEVCYNLTVTFNFNTKLLGTVLSKICDNVIEPKLNLTFLAKNNEEIADQTLALAVEDATKKANILAKAANVELGSIKNIKYNSDSACDYEQPTAMFCARANTNMDSFSGMKVNDISFTNTVNIEWEIK